MLTSTSAQKYLHMCTHTESVKKIAVHGELSRGHGVNGVAFDVSIMSQLYMLLVVVTI